jgi:ABC-type nitrate/sulfonate/bicarbonate transport system substrate-binding protein
LGPETQSGLSAQIKRTIRLHYRILGKRTVQLKTILAVMLAIAGLMLTVAEMRAEELAPVSVIAFPGTGTWPIRIAHDKGYFAQQGIEVTLSPTPNSVFQMTSLIAGKFDIAMTAADNVVAYTEGQGEAPVSGQPDLFIFMGGSPSIPALVTIPEISNYQGLKGRTLAVDAMTTGYAFVLFDLLERHGLKLGAYRVESAGGTVARWQGMRERRYAAAILTSPFDLIAGAEGFNVQQYARDVYGHYEESVATTRRAWAAANETKLVAFIRAYVSAVEWLRDSTNSGEAIAILRQSFPQMSPEVGAGTYANFVGSRGIAAKAALDIAGLRKVLELRSEYGQPKRKLSDPARYYDLRYYDKAIR